MGAVCCGIKCQLGSSRYWSGQDRPHKEQTERQTPQACARLLKQDSDAPSSKSKNCMKPNRVQQQPSLQIDQHGSKSSTAKALLVANVFVQTKPLALSLVFRPGLVVVSKLSQQASYHML